MVQMRFKLGMGVLNPDDSIRTRLMNIALMAFHVLRPRGRERWNLSVGLFGNGFGLTRNSLQKVPFTNTSIVEDLEYHLRFVRSGRKVRFVDGTAVWGQMPDRGRGVKAQRTRWEGGRFRMMMEHMPSLTREVLAWKGGLSWNLY